MGECRCTISNRGEGVVDDKRTGEEKLELERREEEDKRRESYGRSDDGRERE